MFNKKNNNPRASESESSLVVDSQPQYEIIKKSTAEIQDIIQANLGPEGFGPEDLDVVKVPSGGGTIWEVPTDSGIQHQKEIEGIIIGSASARAFWQDQYDGDNTPPDCFSQDLLTGIGTPGGNCSSCPNNEFESAEKGRGKACKEQKRLFLMRRDQIVPLIVRAPPTSLKNVKKYMIRLLSAQKHISAVYTQFTLEKVKDQYEYSRIVLTKIGDVEDPKKTREFAKFFEPKLQRAAAEDLKQRDETE